MRNLKTTLFGLIAAGAAFMAFSPDLFAKWPWVLAVAKFVTVGGLAGLGISAKDGTNHSTVAEVEASTEKSETKGESNAG
jgi:hypothetical protein